MGQAWPAGPGRLRAWSNGGSSAPRRVPVRRRHRDRRAAGQEIVVGIGDRCAGCRLGRRLRGLRPCRRGGLGLARGRRLGLGRRRLRCGGRGRRLGCRLARRRRGLRLGRRLRRRLRRGRRRRCRRAGRGRRLRLGSGLRLGRRLRLGCGLRRPLRRRLGGARLGRGIARLAAFVASVAFGLAGFVASAVGWAAVVASADGFAFGVGTSAWPQEPPRGRRSAAPHRAPLTERPLSRSPGSLWRPLAGPTAPWPASAGAAVRHAGRPPRTGGSSPPPRR